MPGVTFEAKYLSYNPRGAGKKQTLPYACAAQPAPRKIALISDLHGGALPQLVFLEFCKQAGISAIVSLGDEAPCWSELQPGCANVIYRNFAAWAVENETRSFIGLRGNHHDVPKDCSPFYEPEITSPDIPQTPVARSGALPGSRAARPAAPAAGSFHLPGFPAGAFPPLRCYPRFIKQGRHIFVHNGETLAEVIAQRCLSAVPDGQPLLIWHGHTHTETFSTEFITPGKPNFSFDEEGYYKTFTLLPGRTYWANLGTQRPIHIIDWEGLDWDQAWSQFAVYDDEKRQVTMIRLNISKDMIFQAVSRGEPLLTTAPEFVKIPPHLKV